MQNCKTLKEFLHVSKKSIWNDFISKQIILFTVYLPRALIALAEWSHETARSIQNGKQTFQFFKRLQHICDKLTLDLFCIQTLPTTLTINCIETRTRQYSKRCVSAFLRQGTRFSSIQLDKAGSEEDPWRKYRSSNYSDSHRTDWALGMHNFQNACTATTPSASVKKFSKNPQGKNHPEVPSLSRKNTKSKGKNCFIWDILMSLTLGVNDKQTNEPKFLIYSLSSIRLYISFLHFSTFKIQFHGVRIFTFCSGL